MAGSTEMKTMELPSCAESLHDVVDAVEEVAAAIGMGEDSAEEVAIALTEAVNNAIYHGNGGVRETPVRIRFLQEPGILRIYIQDRGAGFDPDAVPDPLAEENLLKPSGRGLLVMRTMMDEVEHHFTESGTEVTLLKRMKDEEKSAG
jgi:serine/threonine-protein kinase RsbW